tara:strand:- start:165 stop:374 length:210 start_codon:yes stop_codon:yes gene_type:complete
MLYFTHIEIIHHQVLKHSLLEMTPIKTEELPKLRSKLFEISNWGLIRPLFFVYRKEKVITEPIELENVL